MLAVVQHQQQRTVPETGHQKLGWVCPFLVVHVQSGHQRRSHLAGFADLGETDPPSAVGEAARKIGRQPPSQPGLADPTRADEADQACRSQHPPGLCQLVPPTHEAGCLGGNVADAASRPAHNDRNVARNPRDDRWTTHRVINSTEAAARPPVLASHT